MKSRSYSAVAISSFLLISISCLAQHDKHDEGPRAIAGDDGPEEKASDERKLDEGVDARAEDDDDKDESRPEADEKAEGAEEPHGDKQHVEEGPDGDETGSLRPDGCGEDAMVFEGSCRSKSEVTKILDRREKDAIEKYRNAGKPQEAAEAAHELLEQQVAQIDKTEDDLDEILEVLREEKRKKDGAKKGDR